MDTSEQYIKMSVQAWPSLKRALEYDDIVYSPSRNLIGRVGYSLDGEAKAKLSVTRWQTCILIDADDWIVVFRQDQLQEMLTNLGLDFVSLLQKFYWFWAGYGEDRKHTWRSDIEWVDEDRMRKDFTSMGQLWLAFTMKEKHGKVWQDGDWKEE